MAADGTFFNRQKSGSQSVQVVHFTSAFYTEDLAIWYADNHQESDDRAPRKRKMKWTVYRTEDTGDCFKVYLAYRPSRMFFSTPGAEMFVVSKSGQVNGRELIRPYNSTLLSTSAVLLAGSVAILAVAGIWLTNSGQISNAQPPSATTHGLAVAVAVAPGHGAHLVSPRGVVRVDIAPGSLSTTGELTFRRVSPLSVTPFPQGVVPTSKVFDLSITDSAHPAGMPLSLLRPVVLTLALNQEELEIASANPDRIAIYHLGGAGQEWEPLPTLVDLEAKTAQALADSLSTFALVISAIPASPETVLQSTGSDGPAKPSPKPATIVLTQRSKLFWSCHALHWSLKINGGFGGSRGNSHADAFTDTYSGIGPNRVSGASARTNSGEGVGVN